MALSTKQKWFIGCGGCLLVILVIIGILIAIGVGIKGTSDKSVNNIFGPVPSGYTALGFPLDMFGGGNASSPKDFAILVSERNRTLWLAFDMKFNEADKALFHTADPVALQKHLTQMLAENEGASKKSTVNDVSVVGITNLTLPPQRQIRVLQLKVSSNRGVMPAILMPIDEKTGNTLLLVGLNNGQASQNSSDFGPSYTSLAAEAQQIIDATAIHNKMATTP